MASETNVSGKGQKKGNAISSALVVAALAAAGGVGHFLWKFQAKLDAPVAAPAAVAGPIVDMEPPAPKKDAPLTQLTELLRVPPPAPAPKRMKAVRGDITIVGKTGTASIVAPPTAEDLVANSQSSSSHNQQVWQDPNAGPRVYAPDDPNRYAPRAPFRSGNPRYYDYEANRFRGSGYDPQFQRRTSVQRNGASGN